MASTWNGTESDRMLGMLRHIAVCLVRRDGPDLSCRQLGVFLTCYHHQEKQTVRGLATQLRVSKPAITRALDRLGELELTRRKTDPTDRRSVLVARTVKGYAFLNELRHMMADHAEQADLPQVAVRYRNDRNARL